MTRHLTLLLLLPLAPVLLGGCLTIPRGTFSRMVKEQNFTPYYPPQGNPLSQASWNLRGPGTILRTKQYEVQYGARHVLGEARLAQIFADANNPQERVAFAAFSNKRTSGNEFDGRGGWTVEGASTIRAALQLKNVTTVDIRFGETFVAELTEDEVRQAPGRNAIDADTAGNLRRGRSHLILKTIYTDSLKIYFNVERSGGGEVGYKIPAIEEQKLGGKYKVTSDGGVEVAGPIMVGYVALPRRAADELFPKR